MAALRMVEKVEQDSYSQPALTGLEEDTPAEITLEQVVVETLPIFSQHKGVNTWDCQGFAGPDIFHQERSEHWQLHARTYATEAKKQRLRPGDIVTLSGIPSMQEIKTAGGKTQCIHHLNVTHMEVLSRCRRVSLTVYESKRGR